MCLFVSHPKSLCPHSKTWPPLLQDMAYVLATGYVASSILLSGFYLRIKDIKIGFIRALSWLSYTKYAMQAMGRIQLHGVTWDPSTCRSSPAGSCPPPPLFLPPFAGIAVNDRNASHIRFMQE